MVYMFANSAFTPPSVSPITDRETLYPAAQVPRRHYNRTSPINAHNENIDKIFFFMVYSELKVYV